MIGAALLLAAAAAVPPHATVTVALHPAVDRPGTVFEGWGTALAWFAEVTGGWPDADRGRLADLLYDPHGLGWTIARFNIGGGDVPGTPPYLRTGAAVPGYWRPEAGGAWRPDRGGAWDWNADHRQRWWLDAVKVRVRAPIFEAFSNSPPGFMTVSGRVSGAERGTDDNLAHDREADFATYLVRVVDELQRRHAITFRTLSPVNEPGTDYWYAANTQEGSHWSPTRQAAMIDATDVALRERGLVTRIAAPDETSARLFLSDWAAYPASTRARIGQVNVHGYGTLWQSGARDAARAAGTRLWMSEYDGSEGAMQDGPDDMGSALALAEHIVADLKHLEPSAWVCWQAVEDRRGGGANSHWGLIKADLGASDGAAHPIAITRKYWAMAQFSRYVRPGYRLVPVDDVDTIGALSPDGRELVLVHVNGGDTSRALAIPAGWMASGVLTDATHDAVPIASTSAPPRSIVTLRLVRSAVTAAGRSIGREVP